MSRRAAALPVRIAGDREDGPKSRGLTDVEVAELREIFNLVDRDSGGTISKDELGDLMETLGIKASQEELDLMIREVDTDMSGEVDFSEFVQVMSRRVNVPYSSAEVKAAFKVFEGTCPSGFVRVTDLIKALNTYGTEKLSDERATELIAQMEPDGNGMINYAEYVTMMMDG